MEEGPPKDPRLQVRRKGSVKCTLKTKSSPHGTLSAKKKLEIKNHKLPSGSELQQLLSGLKLRRIEQRTDGESLPSPEVGDETGRDEQEEARLHTPAMWKQKFSRQVSAGDLVSRNNGAGKGGVGAADLVNKNSVAGKGGLGTRLKGLSVLPPNPLPKPPRLKPVPAKKPASVNKTALSVNKTALSVNKTALSVAKGDNGNRLAAHEEVSGKTPLSEIIQNGGLQGGKPGGTVSPELKGGYSETKSQTVSGPPQGGDSDSKAQTVRDESSPNKSSPIPIKPRVKQHTPQTSLCPRSGTDASQSAASQQDAATCTSLQGGGSSSLVSLSVPGPGGRPADSSPSPTGHSPGRNKTSALKAMFEGSMSTETKPATTGAKSPVPPGAKSPVPSGSAKSPVPPGTKSPVPPGTKSPVPPGTKSPSRSPQVLRRFTEAPPLITPRVKPEPTTVQPPPREDGRRAEVDADVETKGPSVGESRAESGDKPSSARSSASSAYDDVLVGPESGSSDGETETGRVKVRLPKDVLDMDSGRGSTVSTDDTTTVSTVSTDDTTTVSTTDGDGRWSEWVDETSLVAAQKTLRTRSRLPSSTNRHSTDSHPKRSRRGTAPKTRFWSNPERTVSVKSYTSSDYDDVVLPDKDGDNEWETESETSEMDGGLTNDAIQDVRRQGSRHSLTESSDIRRSRTDCVARPRSLTECGDVRRSRTDPGVFHIEDVVDGSRGTGRGPPTAPPRGISIPKPVNPRLQPQRGDSPSPHRESPPVGSPRNSPHGGSPRDSPRGSPVPRIVVADPHRRSVGASRRPRRKVSLDSSIPPPCRGAISRSCTGSGQSDGSGGYTGGSVGGYTGGSVGGYPDTEEPAPRLPPRGAGDYPALPARRPLSTGKEQEPAPPLPPRDSGAKPGPPPIPGSESPPPPTPPRQRPPRTPDLAPNTVVPLSPEARDAARREREREEHRGKPRLPPPRRKTTAATTAKTNSADSNSLAVSAETNSMLAEVPPPPPARAKNRGDDYVGPDPSLPDAPPIPRDGYLAMGNMAAPVHSQSLRRVSESTEGDNYIDPRDIESWPGQQTADTGQPPEPFGGLWKRGESDSEGEDNYLTVLPQQDDPPPRPGTMFRSGSTRFIDEPLYQFYQIGAVARDVLDQHRDDENLDDDDDAYSVMDDGDLESPAKMYETWEELTMSRTKSPAEIKSTLQNVIRTSTGVRTLWSEMPEVRESGIIDRMTMEERKFQETLFELITSEASYLKSLKLLISHFMQSADLTPDVISKRDKHILFSNLVAVHDVSEQFMNELERLWQEDFMLRPALCTLITKYASEDFQVYVTYCSNLAYQERKLRKLREDNAVFREVVHRLERSSQCHGLPLQSFITMPMQRITRFPLLIDAVCKRMPPNHEEYDLVSTALHTFQKLVRQCNEGARQMENLEQMAAIDKQLRFRNLKKMAIVSQGRFLVKKGPLTHLRKDASGILIKKKKEQLYLFLFNDILIITKKKGEDQHQVLDYAARINCHAEAVEPQQLARALPHSAPGNCSNVFVMALLENHQKQPADFYFTCESPSEQLRWVEAVAPAQQVNDDERIYEAWACPQVQTIYRYIAAEPDELSLEEADVVNVLRKMADGWYEGERIRDGTRGWFPANHTVEIQNERVRARNLLQRYRLLTLHTQAPGSGAVTAPGQTGAVRLEASLVSSV